jgi:hypothetical protein
MRPPECELPVPKLSSTKLIEAGQRDRRTE